MFLHKKNNKEELFFVVWALKCDKGEPELFQEFFDSYRHARDFTLELQEFDNLLMAKIFIGKEVKYVC